MPRIKHTYHYTNAYTVPMNHRSNFTHLILQVQYRWVSNFTYKPWAHESHIKQKRKVYCIYILSRSSATIKHTKVLMPCSRTSLQPPRPTLPPRLDQRGRSGRTPLLAYLQLGLESNLSTKGTRKTYAITYTRIMQ